MKKVSKMSVILFRLCAVLWTVRVILDVIYKTYSNSISTFVLNILCAVIWTAAFIANYKRYSSDKDK